MVPEGSLTCSQDPQQWSLFWARWIQSKRPEPISLIFILLLSYHPLLCFRVVSSLHVIRSPYLPCVLHALSVHLTILDLITLIKSGQEYLFWKSLWNFLEPPVASSMSDPSMQSALCFQTPSIYILPLVWHIKFHTRKKTYEIIILIL